MQQCLRFQQFAKRHLCNQLRVRRPIRYQSHAMANPPSGIHGAMPQLSADRCITQRLCYQQFTQRLLTRMRLPSGLPISTISCNDISAFSRDLCVGPSRIQTVENGCAPGPRLSGSHRAWWCNLPTYLPSYLPTSATAMFFLCSCCRRRPLFHHKLLL